MDDVAKRVAEIDVWDRDQCLAAWSKLVRTTPGSRLSLRFLRSALIFETQCKMLGGHSAAVRRSLRAEAKSAAKKTARPAPVLTLGTQLVREWNGRVYRVNVAADGFEMGGESYTSLSAVAKRITGAEWSGPRFFGRTRRAT